MRPAPSIAAASSRATGTESKKPCISHTEKGAAKVTLITMSPHSELTRCRSDIIWYTGTSSSVPGKI
ncbi:hypothetical protein D3C75_1188760 [compost metagenome]